MLSVTNKKYDIILKACDYFQNNQISITKCAKMFNIHRSTLSKYLKEYGIYKDVRKKYTFDENYFEVIDTEHKAYWLGFIMADGCIKSNINQLSIGLSEKDINHLEKFKNSIKATNPITIEETNAFNKNYISCYFRINSKKLCNDLIKLNIYPCKTQCEIPSNIPENLYNHYIRGIFDGDGWVSYGHGWCDLGFGMGKDILVYIKDKFEKYAFVKTSYNVLPYKTIFRYRLTSQKEIRKALDWLYKDATIYLDRKFEIYKNLPF